MDKNNSNRFDRPRMSHESEAYGEGIQFMLGAEEEILHAIFAGVSLPELLNRVCGALDCEIGNVVSLISLLDDNATDFAAIAGNAKHFGLYTFCSRGVVAENHELLGTLQMYSCAPRLPSPRELEIIERASCLAAIAIERENVATQVANTLAAENETVQQRVLEWPVSVN